MVVLSTKLEIAEHHGDVCTGDDEYDEHQEQEAEDIVVVAHPEGLQNEEHLDEDSTVGQDPSDRDSEAAPEEPWLVWDLLRRKRRVIVRG